MARTRHHKYTGAIASARMDMEKKLTQRVSMIEALAWMRAQAKAIQPNVPEDANVYQLAGIISSKISLKKRRVLKQNNRKAICLQTNRSSKVEHTSTVRPEN